MDKLTLPIPGAGGPAAYDQQTLLFTRLAAGVYLLELGTTAQKQSWMRKSQQIDALWQMHGSPRKWGVF